MCPWRSVRIPMLILAVQRGGRRRGAKERKSVDGEEDHGYFSMSNINKLKIGKDPSQSACPQLPRAPCSAQVRISVLNLEVHLRQVVINKLRSLDSSLPSQLVICVPLCLWTLLYSLWKMILTRCGILVGPYLNHLRVTVKLNGGEQSRQVSEEAWGGMMEPIYESQATQEEPGGEDEDACGWPDTRQRAPSPLWPHTQELPKVLETWCQRPRTVQQTSTLQRSQKCLKGANFPKLEDVDTLHSTSEEFNILLCNVITTLDLMSHK